MEGKERVCGLKYGTWVSKPEKEEELAIVAVVAVVALAEKYCVGTTQYDADEMVYVGLYYPHGGGLKVVIMNGYVSGYPSGYFNGYFSDFNCCFSAKLTATAIAAVANNDERKTEYYKGVILSTPHPEPHPTRPAPEKEREVEYYFAGLTAIVPVPTTGVKYNIGFIGYGFNEGVSNTSRSTPTTEREVKYYYIYERELGTGVPIPDDNCFERRERERQCKLC